MCARVPRGPPLTGCCCESAHSSGLNRPPGRRRSRAPFPASRRVAFRSARRRPRAGLRAATADNNDHLGAVGSVSRCGEPWVPGTRRSYSGFVTTGYGTLVQLDERAHAGFRRVQGVTGGSARVGVTAHGIMHGIPPGVGRPVAACTSLPQQPALGATAEMGWPAKSSPASVGAHGRVTPRRAGRSRVR